MHFFALICFLSLLLYASCVFHIELERLPSKRRILPQNGDLAFDADGKTTIISDKSGFESLDNLINLQYIGTIKIGDSQQPFRVLFDTGSTWIWVPGPKEASLFGRAFECHQSSTCHALEGGRHELQYGKGEVGGYAYVDTISFTDDFTVLNQTFLVVDSKKDLGGFVADGLFGLGHSRMENYPTFLENLAEQGLIEKQIFSFYLSNSPMSFGTSPSLLTIGGYNSGFFVEDTLKYMPVVDYSYWAVRLKGLKVGNKSVNMNNGTRYQALIDSGTSHLIVTENIIKELLDILDRDHGIPCDYRAMSLPVCGCPDGSRESFPTLYFLLGSDEFGLKPEYYVDKSSEKCVLLIETSFSQFEINMWILGDVFMRAYYTIFDAEKLKIGFAELRQPPIVPNPINVGYKVIGLSLSMLSVGIIIVFLLRICLLKTRVTNIASEHQLVDLTKPFDVNISKPLNES